MKKISTLLFFTNILFLANAQLTYIPDDAFEAYLESTFPNCSNGGLDDFVIASEVGLNLNILYNPIQSLSGLENLTNVHSINIGFCPNLNSIDLSLSNLIFFFLVVKLLMSL